MNFIVFYKLFHSILEWIGIKKMFNCLTNAGIKLCYIASIIHYTVSKEESISLAN